MTKKQKITIYDPAQIVLMAVKNLGYNPECHIQYSPDIRKWFKIFGCVGLTFWPDDGSKTIVEISTHIKVKYVPEVLAHELAHVIAGHDAAHGPEWRNVFDEIHDEYCRIIEEG